MGARRWAGPPPPEGVGFPPVDPRADPVSLAAAPPETLMRPLLAALLLLAAPAAAQDLPAQFGAAVGAFALPDESNDYEAAAAHIAELLPSLGGDWVAGHILFPGTDELDPELVAVACARLVLRLEPTSPHGFALSWVRDGAPTGLVVRHDYLGFRSFQRSADETAVRAYLGLPEDMMNMNVFTSPAWRGEVQLYHPSPDILVLQPTGTGAEILVRCP